MRRKWSKAQRDNYNATIASRPAISHHSTKLEEWGRKLQRDEVLKAMEIGMKSPSPAAPPDTIYVMLSGTLKKFVLRNMLV